MSSDKTDQKKIEIFTKSLIIKLVLCAALSAFWVIFLWNFWNRGIYALGLNAWIFSSLTILLFVGVLRWKNNFFRRDLIWIIPFVLISLSFALYDNPFLKITSILVFIGLFPVFYNYSFLSEKEKRYWNFDFFIRILKRVFSFLTQIGRSLILYLELIIPANKSKRNIIAKSIAGVILFLIIALTVFIPLLSSADTVFAGKIQVIYNFVKEFFSVPVVYKIITFVILSIITFSMLFAWGKSFVYQEKEEGSKKIDPIIPGIVLGGILLIYLLFLWVQLDQLWIGSLPFDFKKTESLVKSGFWQLFFLSIINILIYFFAYRKTNKLVQWILTAFTVASFLLLFSAAYRMVLYTTYYGFSYEKFFASYTVLFCLILFVWLISRLFIKKRSNMVKFLLILFLWMYAVVTIFPVEWFIMQSNIKLSKMSDSRIKLYELTMLSPDVLSLVKKYKESGVLKEDKTSIYFVEGDTGEKERMEPFSWQPWVEQQETIINNKKWYEKNLMNILFYK